MEKVDTMSTTQAHAQTAPQEPLSPMVSEEDVSTSSSNQRKAKRTVPDTEKDSRYWEKRKRNNLAAKRSRENRRLVESNIRQKVAMLQEDNALLHKEISVIKTKFGVPPNHSFLTEEEIERCRAEVAKDLKSAQTTELLDMECVPAMSVSSASPTPDSTSPHHGDMTANESHYRYSFYGEKDEIKPEERQVNKKRLYNYYQDTVNQNLTPQPMFYNNAPSAHTMMPSVRNETSSPDRIKPFANPAPGYFMSPDQLNSAQSPQFYGQFARFSPASSSTMSHQYEYFWPYGKNNNALQFDYAPTPADLSTPKKRSSEERDRTRSYKRERFTASSRSSNLTFVADEGPAPSTTHFNKRPLSVESNDNGEFAMNGGQSRENSNETHPVYILASQNSHEAHHVYEDTGTGVQSRYAQEEGISSRNPVIQRRSSQEDFCNGNFLQMQDNGDGERLRQENNDLKVRLRQLSTQVSKMKDIVLPK